MPLQASVSRTGKEGSGDFGRFPCAKSRLLRRQSDWLQSHNSELISTCETVESEEHGGIDSSWGYTIYGGGKFVSAHSTYFIINGFILVTFCVQVHMET